MLTMCPSSGLGTKAIEASASTGAAALHSVPFSLGASEDTLKGDILNWRMFICALVLCQLHQFNKKLDGQPQWSSDVSCSNRHTCLVCAWNQRLAVAVLSSCCLMRPTLSTWPVRLL
ncbi:hypothetical protein CapIbe_018433 [Capra ibex]